MPARIRSSRAPRPETPGSRAGIEGVERDVERPEPRGAERPDQLVEPVAVRRERDVLDPGRRGGVARRSRRRPSRSVGSPPVRRMRRTPSPAKSRKRRPSSARGEEALRRLVLRRRAVGAAEVAAIGEGDAQVRDGAPLRVGERRIRDRVPGRGRHGLLPGRVPPRGRRHHATSRFLVSTAPRRRSCVSNVAPGAGGARHAPCDGSGASRSACAYTFIAPPRTNPASAIPAAAGEVHRERGRRGDRSRPRGCPPRPPSGRSRTPSGRSPRARPARRPAPRRRRAARRARARRPPCRRRCAGRRPRRPRGARRRRRRAPRRGGRPCARTPAASARWPRRRTTSSCGRDAARRVDRADARGEPLDGAAAADAARGGDRRHAVPLEHPLGVEPDAGGRADVDRRCRTPPRRGGRSGRPRRRRGAPAMIPSANRKPSARSASAPGVRIVVATASPSTRISSGSSTATASSAWAPPVPEDLAQRDAAGLGVPRREISAVAGAPAEQQPAGDGYDAPTRRRAGRAAGRGPSLRDRRLDHETPADAATPSRPDGGALTPRSARSSRRRRRSSRASGRRSRRGAARAAEGDLVGRLRELRDEALESTAKDLPTVFQEMGVVRAVMERARPDALPDPAAPVLRAPARPRGRGGARLLPRPPHVRGPRGGRAGGGLALGAGRGALLPVPGGRGVRGAVPRARVARRRGRPARRRRGPRRARPDRRRRRRARARSGRRVARGARRGGGARRRRGDGRARGGARDRRGRARPRGGAGRDRAPRRGAVRRGRRPAPRRRCSCSAAPGAARRPSRCTGSRGSRSRTRGASRRPGSRWSCPETGLARLAARLLEPLGLDRAQVRTVDAWARGSFQSAFGVAAAAARRGDAAARRATEAPPGALRGAPAPAAPRRGARRRSARCGASSATSSSTAPSSSAVVPAAAGGLPTTAIEETLRHTRLQLAPPSEDLSGDRPGPARDARREADRRGHAAGARRHARPRGSARSCSSSRRAPAGRRRAEDRAPRRGRGGGRVALRAVRARAAALGPQRHRRRRREPADLLVVRGLARGARRARRRRGRGRCGSRRPTAVPRPIAELAHAILGPLAPAPPPRAPAGRARRSRASTSRPRRTRTCSSPGAIRDLVEREPRASVAVVAHAPEVARSLHRLLADLPEARLALDGRVHLPARGRPHRRGEREGARVRLRGRARRVGARLPRRPRTRGAGSTWRSPAPRTSSGSRPPGLRHRSSRSALSRRRSSVPGGAGRTRSEHRAGRLATLAGHSSPSGQLTSHRTSRGKRPWPR